MDPTEALESALDGLADAADPGLCATDREYGRQVAIVRLQDLARWLAKGGFAPDPQINRTGRCVHHEV